ncbi:MAG: PKD domain-containing protein, partial [Chitinophagaceae bacterium]|nr:PKD domain-containing protein [Chitinophagaceae bacterium]
TISVSTAGTYSVTVTYNGCSASDSKVITVTAPPTVNLGPDAAICSGSSTTLDAGNPGAGATYSWSTGASTRTISVSTAGTYSVTVTYNGCSASDSKVITVTAPPTVNLGPDAAICSGSSTTLDAGNPGAGAIYSWSTGATSQTISVSTAGTYSVTVTYNGCSASDSKVISVNASGLVVDLGPDKSMCAGGTLMLDAGITGVTYKWGSTYSPVYASMTSKTVIALGVGKYWVTVTNGGCSATDTIVISEKPKVAPKFGYSQTGSCSPIVVSFTDSTTACTSISNYEWNFGDGSAILTGSPDPSLKNPVHTYAQPGIYHVTLKVTITGETKTYEEDVIVSGTGIPVNLGNDTAICAGNTIILDAGSHSGATYEWMPNGETTQSISVSDPGTYIVTVTKDGCKTIDAIQVNVVPALTVDLGNDTTICPGNPVILDAGNPGATYLWSTGETTQTITANSAGTYSVTVSRGGCSGSGSININVNSTLPVTLGNDTTICAGSTITFDAGYPGATFVWSNAATTQSITVTDAGVYKVTVNSNGCVGEAEVELTLMPAATPVNLGNDTTICFGNMITLDAGNPGATYIWSTGETTQLISPTVSGVYSVTVSRCGITEKDSIDVVIANLPTPSISQSGNELVATDAENYQWYKNGVLIPGANAKKYKPRGYGRYKIAVTSVATGCYGESTEYFFVPEGQIYIGDIKIKISPNPGNGRAKLIFSKIPPKPIKVTIYDRVGRRILVTTMNNTVNDIDLMAYAKGEYFVECILDDKRTIIPLVTQ